jgi:hypothetical protein
MKKYLLFLTLWGIVFAAYAQVAGGGSKKSSSKGNTITHLNTDPPSTKPEMKAWDWKDYNLKFEVPKDFKVTKSDGSTFIAENGKINLSIYPRKGEQLLPETMESTLLKWAKDNKVTNYEKATFIENLKGFQCYYIDGKVGEFPTSLMLMVNLSNPEISLYIWLSYDAAEFETAVEILKSFKPFE